MCVCVCVCVCVCACICACLCLCFADLITQIHNLSHYATMKIRPLMETETYFLEGEQSKTNKNIKMIN